MNITAESILSGHDTPETAYVCDDYPFGFRLRCKIRYWIESTKKGDRFCSQTTNPKVDGEVWNKPKKSTYSDVGVMFLDDQGHVKWTGVHIWAQREVLDRFAEVTEGRLTDEQAKRLRALIAFRDAYERRQAERSAAEAAAGSV